MILGKQIPASYLFGEVRNSLFFIIVAGVVGKIIPLSIGAELMPTIPPEATSTLGVAISLLLSFKLSQSYARWWEARQIWGAIVNDSRTWVMQLKLYAKGDDAGIQAAARRQIAWCYALACALRRQESCEEVREYLGPKQVALLDGQQNPPLKILDLQHEGLQAMHERRGLELFSLTQLENTLTRLTASMGKCERIKNTVFPPTYKLALQYAIYLFTILFGITSMRLHVVIEVVILLFISGTFFFLDQVANRLQDPFENLPTDTAMTGLSQTVEVNIRQLLGEKAVPQKTQSSEFYLM